MKAHPASKRDWLATGIRMPGENTRVLNLAQPPQNRSERRAFARMKRRQEKSK
jgi:hypothetical protein